MIDEEQIMKNQAARILGTIFIFVLFASCAEAKDLSRPRALALIKDAKEFKEPAMIVLRDDYGEVSVPAQSVDEKEVDAQARAVEAFLDNHPMLAVLKHLNLIEVTAEVIQKPKVVKAPEIIIERPSGITTRNPIDKDSLEPWKFNVRVSLTAKGKEAAGNNERAIPIYTKQVLEVTGIITTQNGGAQAGFTWRAVPTAVGESFDPKSAAYQRLPLKLQETLKNPTGLLQRTPLAETSEVNASVKKGVAYFQRYDDGWRLVSVQ